MEQIKTIFWDFDGVLMDSNPLRDIGFEKVLCDYPKEEVDKLMLFHKENGGLSRYVKFRYFFETIREETISEDEVKKWADKFSIIVTELLKNEQLLIEETLSFVKKYQDKYSMHIVSGSDGNELKFICEYHHISHLFKSIEGSPTPKKDLVKNILHRFNYSKSECILVGDSINDFEAAELNSIYFKGYGNARIQGLTNINFLL